LISIFFSAKKKKGDNIFFFPEVWTGFWDCTTGAIAEAQRLELQIFLTELDFGL